MKRPSSSDSQAHLISICPSTEDHKGGGGVYSREFQSMLDGYEEEDNSLFEDSGAASGHVAEKKRRLSVDQVKALEKNFEVENKLEPERKVKLAQELGLQPRQVAVWFQNRRARWKTKQLEKDYGILKANYDSLKENLDALQQDNEALIKEIKKLKSKLNEEESPGKEGLGSESDNPASEPDITAAPDHQASMEFKDAGPSDSDTSAILNDNNNNNNNNNSPKAEIVGASNSNSPPPGFNYVNTGGGGFQFFNLATTEASSSVVVDEETKVYQTEYVKMEEHNFFSEEAPCCSNFFSEDQAPTLHWYTPENWA